MTALQAMGWQDVKVMKGGSYGGWVEAGYPAVEGLPPEALVLEVAQPDPALAAKMDAMLSALPESRGGITADAFNTELIEDSDLILIDVRRAEELAEQGVVEAENELIHIPIEEFMAQKEMWPVDKDANIVSHP